MLRVALSAVAIFLFMMAGLGAFVRGDLVLTAAFGGLVFLTLATAVPPSSRIR